MIFVPLAYTPQTFYCCFFVFVLSSLSCLSSLSSLSSPSLSSPSFPGLVINSCQGSTSSLPPAGGRVLHCWLDALGCSVCGAALLSLHTCLCTTPRETTLTSHSPEGYLHREGGHHITITFMFHLSFCSCFLDLAGKCSFFNILGLLIGSWDICEWVLGFHFMV